MTLVAMVQGFYFLITGVWPLVSMATFQKVTGPKSDHWLVKTVGIIVAVIGLGLIISGVSGHFTPEIILIAIGSATGLAGIDVIYVSKRVISPIYLLDALAEVVLILWWAVSLLWSQ